MRQATIYRRGRKLYFSYYDGEPPKRHHVSSGYVVGQEKLAQAALDILVAKLAESPSDGPLTVASYIERWCNGRTNKTAKDEKARLTKHVAPTLGSMLLDEVTPELVRQLFDQKLAKTIEAPRTRRHVYDDLRRMYRDAVRVQLVARNPTDGVEAPKKRDKDPTWRKLAVFEASEAAKLITDARIPMVRRVFYAIVFLTGARSGEAAALRWKAIQDGEPLRKLMIAEAFNTKRRKIGDLKAKSREDVIVRLAPIAPLLSELLDKWRKEWSNVYARDANEKDLIAPMPRTRGKGRRIGGPDVPWRDKSIRNALHEDCRLLGLRERAIHDGRATFLTMAEEAGCSTLIRLVTHAPERSVHRGYVRRVPWKPLCEDVLRATESVAKHVAVIRKAEKSQQKTGWSRRESNPRPKADPRRILRA
jgi:integrase